MYIRARAPARSRFAFPVHASFLVMKIFLTLRSTNLSGANIVATLRYSALPPATISRRAPPFRSSCGTTRRAYALAGIDPASCDWEMIDRRRMAREKLL